MQLLVELLAAAVLQTVELHKALAQLAAKTLTALVQLTVGLFGSSV